MPQPDHLTASCDKARQSVWRLTSSSCPTWTFLYSPERNKPVDGVEEHSVPVWGCPLNEPGYRVESREKRGNHPGRKYENAGEGYVRHARQHLAKHNAIRAILSSGASILPLGATGVPPAAFICPSAAL